MKELREIKKLFENYYVDIDDDYDHQIHIRKTTDYEVEKDNTIKITDHDIWIKYDNIAYWEDKTYWITVETTYRYYKEEYLSGRYYPDDDEVYLGCNGFTGYSMIEFKNVDSLIDFITCNILKNEYFKIEQRETERV